MPTHSSFLPVAVENHLQFGHASVGSSVQIRFSLVSHSSESIRYQWPTSPAVTFSPSMGHIHPHGSAEILATTTSTRPKTMKLQKFSAKYWMIAYPKPIQEVK